MAGRRKCMRFALEVVRRAAPQWRRFHHYFPYCRHGYVGRRHELGRGGPARPRVGKSRRIVISTISHGMNPPCRPLPPWYRGRLHIRHRTRAQEVSIPVITSNRINMPQVAEDVLAQGDADLVSMARPMLADSDFMNKAAEDRADEINTCIACNQACLDHTFSGKTTSCLVNPRACHETLLKYEPTTTPRKLPLSAQARGSGLCNCCRRTRPSVTYMMRRLKSAASSIWQNWCPARKSFTKHCAITAHDRKTGH